VRERTLELVRTNEALGANEAKFRGFVESGPDAVVIMDQRGEVFLVNSQTERMFGYPPGELHGRPKERLLPKRLRASHVSHRQRYFAEPEARPMAFGLEVFGRRKDGTEFPIEITLSPLPTEEGTLFCAAIRDVNDRRRLEGAATRKPLTKNNMAKQG
jgi:PAS domain S-box-containing protein